MKYTNVLFVDIETVPQAHDYVDLKAERQYLFSKRFKHRMEQQGQTDFSPGQYYEDHAGLYAEHGQICAIAMGFLNSPDQLRIKSIASKDEKYLLTEFIKVVEMGMTTQLAMPTTGKYVPPGPPKFSELCAHNGKQFDFPWLCRRMIVHGIRIPHILNPTGKKTWELSWLDTMEIWGFSEWKYRCSLDLLCNILGIPSSKQEMDGSEVKDYFYGVTPGKEDLPFGKFDKEEARFEAIARYCGGDIVALVNLFLRLMGEAIIPEEKVLIATEVKS